MPKSNHKNIAITGAGLSGLITALRIASAEFKVTIFEKLDISSESFFQDIRTTAINAGSRDFFEKLGLWEQLGKVSAKINDIYVVDNESEDMIHFDSNFNDDERRMGYIIENIPFKKILLEAAKKHPNIEICDSVTYKISDQVNNAEDKKVTIEYYKTVIGAESTRNFNTDLVILCDSRNSQAKNYYFHNQENIKFNQHALVFNVEHEKPHGGTAIEHFTETGPFAILPLMSEYRSSIVWTVPTKMLDSLAVYDQDNFAKIVQEKFGEHLGKITVDKNIAQHELRASITKQYYNNRIVLVADSAHVFHPLAGQGLNYGIKDIDALSKSLTQYDISDKALAVYQKERAMDNRKMFMATNLINKAFNDRPKIEQIARNFAFKFIESQKVLKKKIMGVAMGGKKN